MFRGKKYLTYQYSKYDNFLYIASNEDDYTTTDYYSSIAFQSLDLTLPFKNYYILKIKSVKHNINYSSFSKTLKIIKTNLTPLKKLVYNMMQQLEKEGVCLYEKIYSIGTHRNSSDGLQ